MPATAVRASLSAPATEIRTPDQRVRVFLSSTLKELAAERQAAREAVTRLRLVPVMFELGARPHSPRRVYRSYLAQSQIFVGVYWQSYGWVAPGEEISGLEDEYRLSAGMPRLIYVKSPAPEREPRLAQFLARISEDDSVSYQLFSDPAELQGLIENDLAVLLSERFETTRPGGEAVTAASLDGVLPAAVSALVGRQGDIAALQDLVSGHGARLVTLTGPGGVGKSRLAVEAAGWLAPRFADGVRFVDLAPVTAADLVAGTIAARLRLRTSGGKLMTDLVTYLRPRQVLLVLDNFEQVAGTAPVIAELLAAAPGLVILVTSRMVLNLGGEHEFPVPPLGVPPAGADQDAAGLEQYASVRLFEERARATAPDFELTSDNARAVAQICRRLDGLPLAIELAAARIRMLPPEALLARLDEGLTVLAEGPRDLPERQRTLRATLDWSFGLLTADQQALFARLGVFAGTFGLPAMAAVCGPAADSPPPEPDGPLVDTLSALVDSSLVRPQAQGDEPRFALLETVRKYALERLRDSGDWREIHDRHAAYYRRLAEPADSELRGAGQLAWLDRLETRHDNLTAALSWLLDTGQPGPALELMWMTWRFWWLHGHAEELARHAERLLDSSNCLPPRQRALALAGVAFTLVASGGQARAQRLLEQSLPLYRQAGDALDRALAAAALAHLLAAQDQGARATELLEDTLGEIREAGRSALTPAQRFQYLLDLALTDNLLGQIRLSNSDHDGAAQLFASGLAAARRASDRFTILVSLYDLALSCQARGDLAGAAGRLLEGLSVAAEAGDGPSAAYYLEALAAVASLAGDPDRAVGLLTAAGGLLQTSGSGWLHAYVPRAPHGRTVLAALRTRIGEAAFEQAQAKGRSVDGARAVPDWLGQAWPDLGRP